MCSCKYAKHFVGEALPNLLDAFKIQKNGAEPLKFMNCIVNPTNLVLGSVCVYFPLTATADLE